MKRKIFLNWLTIFVITILPIINIPHLTREATASGIHPMPPHPSVMENLQVDEDALAQFNNRYQRGIDTGQRFPIPPTGPFNLLVVAVDFSDKTGTPGLTPFFDNLFFSLPTPPPTGPGSVMDYFTEVSYGTFNLTFVTPDLPGTLGWQRAPNPYNGPTGYVNADGLAGTADDYGWGSFPQNLQGLVTDMLPILDAAGVDFSKYDNDGDGFVESIAIVHSGTGAELSLSPNDIWSSAWNLSDNNGPGPQLVDGVYVDNFMVDPELWNVPTDMTIGVFCHEMGHSIFGLPDLYDVDGSSNGVGNWSLMGTGSWNGPGGWGNVPAWPEAWSRITMGFDFTMPVTGAAITFPFNPVETGPGQTILLNSNRLGPREYFLVEFRDQTVGIPPNFDQNIPGSGLLVWHIDEAKWNTWEHNTQECTNPIDCNCPNAHALVTLEQADGLLDLENATNWGDTGDPFPGSSNNTSFTFNTNPESVSYYAPICSPTPTDSCISIQNIHIISPFPVPIFGDIGTVCQNAFPPACLEVEPSNQVGWGQPGTETAYRVTIQNCSNTFEFAVTVMPQSNWTTTFFDPGTGQPYIGPPQSSMFPGGTWTLGITVTVPTGAHWNASDVLTMTLLSGNDPTYSSQDTVTTQVPYCTLVVDDDRSSPDVEGNYLNALANGNFSFDYWDTDLQGSLDAATLAAHSSVIWFTGSPWAYTLHPREELALAGYLDNGGNLFLSSQEYLTDTGRTDFNLEYLQIFTFTNDIGTNQVTGIPGNPVGDGLGPYTFSSTAPLSDRLTPSPLASAAFIDTSGSANAITRDSGSWKTLFIAWPLENLTQSDADELTDTTMDWFGIPPNPTARFTTSHTIATVDKTITFTNTSLNATAYLWDFGDGFTSTLTNPLHAYTTPMTATVKLTADNCCGTDDLNQNISVYNIPIASFTPSSIQVNVGDPISFTNTSQYASNFQWDFGDGIGTSNGIHPTYTYTTEGSYIVTLVASNPAATDLYTRQIQVGQYFIYLPMTSKPEITAGNSADFPNGIAIVLTSLVGFSIMRATPWKKKTKQQKL